MSRDALRQSLRAGRRALDIQQRAQAAHAITRHVVSARWLHGQRPIGLYVSVGFEVNTQELRRLARKRHCPVYLPRINDYRQRAMRFARDRDQPSLINRHGIPEPSLAETIPARGLSVVFLPLLGFDSSGTRLGSGAGYYDRAFAFRQRRHSWHRPLLVGLAFACQRVDHIERGTYDVPLDAVVTEHGVEYF
ncbi:MAG TPA: 5-formyltetrahydrofolate cyclo-ligase [Steroidobacteraceae bacterium]|jgi:5-formyltetrahydrofolate cyclo-ligase